MTRKDYIAIAAAIRPIMGNSSMTPTPVRLAVIAIAQNLADALERDNARFNREQFLQAALYA